MAIALASPAPKQVHLRFHAFDVSLLCLAGMLSSILAACTDIKWQGALQGSRHGLGQPAQDSICKGSSPAPSGAGCKPCDPAVMQEHSSASFSQSRVQSVHSSLRPDAGVQDTGHKRAVQEDRENVEPNQVCLQLSPAGALSEPRVLGPGPARQDKAADSANRAPLLAVPTLSLLQVVCTAEAQPKSAKRSRKVNPADDDCST